MRGNELAFWRKGVASLLVWEHIRGSLRVLEKHGGFQDSGSEYELDISQEKGWSLVSAGRHVRPREVDPRNSGRTDPLCEPARNVGHKSGSETHRHRLRCRRARPLFDGAVPGLRSVFLLWADWTASFSVL